MDKTIEINVFMVYCNEDKTFRDELELHLKILKRQGMINKWVEREILPNQQWDNVTAPELNNSDIILMVTSPVLLGSGYLTGSEAKTALELHNAGKADLIPVILKDCAWETPPLDGLMPLPESGKPVISSHWRSIDEAFVNIDKALKRVIKRRKEKKEAEKATLHPVKIKKSRGKGTDILELAGLTSDVEKVIESPNKTIYPRDSKNVPPG